MIDPIEDMADGKLLEMSIDISVQLEKGSGTRPVLWLLRQARERAAIAMAALCTIGPTDTAGIIELQGIVSRYSHYVSDCRELLARGREADMNISDDEREEIASMLNSAEAEALGLRPTRIDT